MNSVIKIASELVLHADQPQTGSTLHADSHAAGNLSPCAALAKAREKP
jgi:hypothetical protein